MTKPINGNCTFTRSVSQIKIDRLLAFLHEPRAVDEIAEELVMTKRGAQRYICGLLLEPERRIHIAGWRRNGAGSPSPLYIAGAGEDARKISKLSDHQSYRRYVEKHPEYLIEKAARKRLARHKPKRDAMTAALFGAA